MDAESSTSHKRVGLACEACRKRKRKCDGVRPICSWCQNQDKDCQYDTHPEGGRKRKRNIDYITSLEEQLDSLKAYVRDLETRSSQPSRNTAAYLEYEIDLAVNGNSPPNADSGLGSLRDHLGGDDHRLSSAVDEVGSLMWQMSINEVGDTSFIGPSGNFCFSTSTSPASINKPETVVHDEYDEDSLVNAYTDDTILHNELLQIFTDFINPFHQFVQPAEVVSRAFDIHDSVTALVQSAIFAAGSRLSARSNANQIGQYFASLAENLALKCCRENPSLNVIQALTIMCWRELSLENENMAWMYNSMAASLCTHLGLHVGSLEYLQAQSSEVDSTISNTIRIRTFWQFFLMDRMITSILGRQCTIPWRRVRTPPFHSILTDSCSLEEVVFDHQCRLWLLHDQYMDQIYSFEFPTLGSAEKNKLLMDARERVVTFHQGIDNRLRFGKVLESGHIACFQMSYQMSLLLIHRPFLREPPESASYRLALRSMTSAAATMASLIRAYRKLDGFRRAPFYIIHHILTAAIMHLLSATSSQPTLRQQSISRFRVCVEALEELQGTWSRAKKSIRLLQELANRWSVVFALPMRLSNVIPAIEGEMQRKAPALDGDIVNNRSDHSLDLGHGADNTQQENDGDESNFGPGYLAIPMGIDDDDLWMDPDTFIDFAAPDNSWDNMGLDWLFTPQQ